MKKYQDDVDKYRLYECLLGIILIAVILFGNANNLKNTKNEEYKSNKSIYIFTKEQNEFLENWNGLPVELREWMDNPKPKAQVKENTYEILEGFTVSAYDLSVQSCGKKITSRGYGITRTGFDLKGHTYKTARVIAVDPSVIPLGSKVYIQFTNEEYKNFSGIYHAEDTGRLIKGNKIDFFMEDTGEKVSQKAMDFGLTKANIIILKRN